MTFTTLKNYSVTGSRSESEWKSGCQSTCPASKGALSCPQGKRAWDSALNLKQGGALENELLSNCIGHFLLRNKRLGKVSWLYFTSSSFSKHKNSPLFFFLTREQLILSPLDPHTGTHYNYLESRWFPGRGEKWKNKIQSNKKERKVQSLGNGNWWTLPRKSPPVLQGCHPRSQICSHASHAGLHGAEHQGNTGPVICMQQGCTRSQGKGKGQRPVNLKEKATSVLGAFDEWKTEKQYLLTLAFPNSYSLYCLYHVTCF